MPTIEKVARTDAGLASELRLSVMRLRAPAGQRAPPRQRAEPQRDGRARAACYRHGEHDRRRAGRARAVQPPSMTRTVNCLEDGRYVVRAARTRPTAARSWSRSPSRPRPRAGRPPPPRRLAGPAARRARPPTSAPSSAQAAPILEQRSGPSRPLSPTFRSLHNPNYRRYAAGGVVSNIGTWMQRVAQDWLVLQLTGNSGTALGITTGLQFLPFLLLSPFAGLVADRVPKRRLLQLTNVGMARARAGPRRARGDRHRRRSGTSTCSRFVLGIGAGLRRPGPPVVRLRDGRPRRPAQRGRPQLRQLQRRPHRRARRWPAC